MYIYIYIYICIYVYIDRPARIHCLLDHTKSRLFRYAPLRPCHILAPGDRTGFLPPARATLKHALKFVFPGLQ